ncbi:protein of unknown function (plasmid) [Streptantibioticus cattleyicolor NRRL 8057 = DSM 46488]|nr:protein of unknown function [Streptantibioticus cattleyicolor NRRL 8057 = DSM 46488]
MSWLAERCRLIRPDLEQIEAETQKPLRDPDLMELMAATHTQVVLESLLDAAEKSLDVYQWPRGRARAAIDVRMVRLAECCSAVRPHLRSIQEVFDQHLDEVEQLRVVRRLMEALVRSLLETAERAVAEYRR